MENDRLGGAEDSERFDRSHHFHTIVRGLHAVAESLSALLTVLNNVRPPAGARIPETTSIRKDLNHA